MGFSSLFNSDPAFGEVPLDMFGDCFYPEICAIAFSGHALFFQLCGQERCDNASLPASMPCTNPGL